MFIDNINKTHIMFIHYLLVLPPQYVEKTFKKCRRASRIASNFGAGERK